MKKKDRKVVWAPKRYVYIMGMFVTGGRTPPKEPYEIILQDSAIKIRAKLLSLDSYGKPRKPKSGPLLLPKDRNGGVELGFRATKRKKNHGDHANWGPELNAWERGPHGGTINKGPKGKKRGGGKKMPGFKKETALRKPPT